MQTRALAFMLVLACAGAWTAQAEARWERPESPSEADIEAARQQYERGLAFIDALRWDDALRAFERAYARSGVGAALYNVAVALRALGRHVEARDALRQLAREHAELDASMRAGAETLLREEEARVASIVLEELPREPAPSVRLDGRLLTDDPERPLRLEVDPGSHALFVTAPGMRAFEWQGSLEEGARLPVVIELEPLPAGAGIEIALVVIGGILAASIAAAVIGWALWDADEIAPRAPQVIRL